MDVCWDEICYGSDTRMAYEGYYRVSIVAMNCYFLVSV